MKKREQKTTTKETRTEKYGYHRCKRGWGNESGNEVVETRQNQRRNDRTEEYQ